MKVGIITYHFPYNCGAVLQCLALKTTLEKLGHEVCVINYRPWYHQNRYTPLKNPFYYANKRFHDPANNYAERCWHAFDGFLRVIHSWMSYPAVSKKERKFHPFINRYLNETKRYRTLKQLQKKPPECDVYIAGSDQVWNCGLTCGEFDSAYFLNFGDKKVGRITYSVGANFNNLENPETVLKELVKDLDAISLRETKWLPAVEAAVCGKIPTHIDLDPTLLLDAQMYERFMPRMPEEPMPYILTYTMTGEAQKYVYDSARLLSKKLGMRVIDVAGDPTNENKRIEDNRLCGPDEFLWYVKNAEYVVTNSFHGTVFALLFQKNFITIPHAQTGNRVTELLDKLNLSARYCNNPEEAANTIINDIDYTEVYEKLNVLRKDSIEYLSNSIQRYGYKGD